MYLNYTFLSSYYSYSKGKSLSEALIFASSNPQYDKRLFTELPWTLQAQNMGRTCSAHCSAHDAKIRASDKDLPVQYM